MLEIVLPVRREEHEAPGKAVVEVRPPDAVFAFGRSHAAFGDERAHAAVAFAVGREQHELRPVGEPHFGADDEREPAFFRRDVRAHHARDRAFVGDRERAVAERGGALDELLGMRCAAQEGEVREAVELGVGGKLVHR